ncbi:MAG: alanine racemase [Caldilineaceae bacterium]|nr:alanine racemase [Caldilineaceae bacterium]
MMLAPRPTWLEISRSAILNNIGALRTRIGPDCRLMLVLKANAYGHGAAEVARLGQEAGAQAMAVAALSEALDLRRVGIDGEILVLGYTPSHLAATAAIHAIRLAAYDFSTLYELNEAARSVQQPLTLHVKVNTGMNRLGVAPDEVVPFLQAVHDHDHLRVEGLFTHFATSDLTDKQYAYAQFVRFQAVVAAAEEAGLRPPLVHAANSAAIFTMPETHLDMVRSGIAVYGLDPDADEAPLPAGFQPALSWKAEVGQVRTLQPGDAVSYGREFIAQRPMTVAVLPVGYADGFPRRPHNWGSVLLYGREAPILGRVCMDQTMVDVTAISEEVAPVRMGDEAVLIGRQGDAEISAAEAGRRIGTINYDVVSRILARVPRVLVE